MATKDRSEDGRPAGSFLQLGGAPLRELVLIGLCFLVGWFVGASNGHLSTWKLAVIALGALSLGFGAAVLVYRRLQDRETDDLERSYKDLSRRAGLLLSHAQLFENKLDEKHKTAL